MVDLVGVQTIAAVQLPHLLVLRSLKTTCRCLASMSCSLVYDNPRYKLAAF
jgi:hypothetical protein